jgi:hypothetical protein
MRRYTTRGRANHQTIPPRAPANHCRALVLADGTAIRKKIKRNYEKALRDLANSRQRLDQFNQTDQPQFTRWFNSHFGAQLTEIRELTQKIAADEELIFQVEDEVFLAGGSYARAYRRVMELRENPPPPPEYSQRSGPRGRNGSPFEDPIADSATEAEESDRDGDPFEEFLEEVFEDMFGGFDPNMFGGFGPNGEKNSRSRATNNHHTAAPHAHARLKDLYRKLVRRLHPDAQAQMTAQKTEWWHEAQAAYEAGDADKLEVILTLCEIEDNGTAAGTSASLLHRITEQLKHSLRELKRQLRERQREPAWNFSKRTDLEELASHLRAEITRDLEGLRMHCRANQNRIAAWKAGAEKLKQPRQRKLRRQPPDVEFPF